MKKFWWIVIPAILLFFFLCVLLLSCNVLKKSSSDKSSEGNIKKENFEKSDSSKGGSVSKNSNSSTEQLDWWKTTLQFGNKRDTNTTVTNVYPSTIVYEGGKQTKQDESSSFDSSFFQNQIKELKNSVDSTNKLREIEMNSKKTSPSLLMYGLVTAAIIIFVEALKLIKSKFKIVRV